MKQQGVVIKNLQYLNQKEKCLKLSNNRDLQMYLFNLFSMWLNKSTLKIHLQHPFICKNMKNITRLLNFQDQGSIKYNRHLLRNLQLQEPNLRHVSKIIQESVDTILNWEVRKKQICSVDLKEQTLFLRT